MCIHFILSYILVLFIYFTVFGCKTAFVVEGKGRISLYRELVSLTVHMTINTFTLESHAVLPVLPCLNLIFTVLLGENTKFEYDY